MRVLITGANGFLARSIADQFPDEVEAIALVRVTTGDIHPRYELALDSVDDLISETADVDAVLHLAACIPTTQGSAPQELEPVNVDLPRRLLDAYPTARHILASSVSTFGTPCHLPLTMEVPPNNAEPYGLSKLAAERIIQQASSHAIIRFSSIIGTSMKPGSFIPTVVAGAKAGHIRLFGSGCRLQNYIAVEDAATMCWRALARSDSFSTLGVGPRSHTNNEIAELLAQLGNATITREGIDRSPSYRYDLNTSVDLGPSRTTIEQSLEKMMQA